MESCQNDFLSTLGEDLQTTSCALLRLAVISVASYSKIIDYLGFKVLVAKPQKYGIFTNSCRQEQLFYCT